MNKRIGKAVALALAGSGLSTLPMGGHAITNTGKNGTVITSLSNIDNTSATQINKTSISGLAPLYSWDGHNSHRDEVPNVFNGSSQHLGWAHNTNWFDVNITKAGNYRISLIRANAEQTGFHPAFSLWPVGTSIFDFDTCVGHCGDATGGARGTHSYNQVAAPSATNANAWMLGPNGPIVNPDAQPMLDTLRWTPQPGTGAVAGFIGYANSGNRGWKNGMPINPDGGTYGNVFTYPNFNISQDQDLVGEGYVNTAVGGGLGGTTLAPASNFSAPEGGGTAAMNLYSLAAGHYLIAVGGSCHAAEKTANPCGTLSTGASYLLEIAEIAGEGPQASAKASSPVRAGALATLDGGGSYDPDGDKLAYAWRQSANDSVQVDLSDETAAQPSFTAPTAAVGQTLNFTLTVTDPTNASSTADVAVAIGADNNPPTVTITSRPVLEDSQVTLTSSASDPDGDRIASYLWTQTGGVPVALSKVDGPSLSFTAPSVGTGAADLAFSLKVTDDYALNPQAATATASLSINNDPNKLDCSTATANPSTLDKPNKGMKPVRVEGVAGPNPFNLKITGVASSEPVKSKAGKDGTGPDAKIVRGKITKKIKVAVDSVLLRAERQAPPAMGRLYTVKFTASDGAQSCDGSAQVRVPVSPGASVVDDGQSFDATRKK